jgi:hypothetical protein
MRARAKGSSESEETEMTRAKAFKGKKDRLEVRVPHAPILAQKEREAVWKWLESWAVEFGAERPKLVLAPHALRA